MAPRKRLLINDPPSVTNTTSESSDDDKNDYIQLPCSSKKQPVVVEGEEEIGDEDSSSEEEEEDSSSEELQHSQPAASQNPPPSTPNSNPNPKPVASAESGPKTTTPHDTKLKQHASKPIKAQPQAQSSAQAQTTPKSGNKRANDDNNANGNAAKRSKGKETVSAAAGGRIFSEGDELTILRGVADFLSKTGKDPSKNIDSFHDFVKNSLGATVTNQQLKRKIRGLKEKYESGDNFIKPHDKKALELFKKIKWGNNGGNVAGEENGKAVDVKSPKKDVNVKVKHVGSSSKNVGSGVDNNFILNEIFRSRDAKGLPLNKDDGKRLNKDDGEKRLEMIGESRRAEMVHQWRQLHVAELEVYVNRAQLVKDHTSYLLEELTKSTH
ncbi:probable transcription factor At4g00390 [Trifolium pratense]|uniref:probable transcription factor At4g00390 n=1 Tax=Trifolium pratense TaxID=57577 RepID=UPI001E68FFC5|nr:probable transcription factor At4g00390 [Trifolium pratense]XP_045789024.1 probable transcription factor At4g00390 [Trifolium pratense]XP_045789025.1 probable transcription factor At4g00390 [Trifolium pratense]